VKKILVVVTTVVVFLTACDQGPGDGATEAYASRYAGLESGSTILTGATVLTGTGERFDNADVLIADGKIVAVGVGLSADGADVVDASGKWVTPGVIDVHSHLGVYPSPGTQSHSDGNEVTEPVTAAWLGQPDWWQGRHIEERAGPQRHGYEIPGCSTWHENGVRRESQTRLWRSGTVANDTYG